MAARPSASGGACGGTSLRGLREQMVAVAQAIADERRNQNRFTPVASQHSNLRSSFKPVIDGSVLKNDTKQKLVKERREEKRRQEDANKETQLLEKERKARLQYEKQIEERQRKLKEQKDRDERRRISAEEKRKQKLAEEQAKFKAVVHRTLERSSRVGRQQKRWSWESSFPLDCDSKCGITKNKRSSSLSRKDKLHSFGDRRQSENEPGTSTTVFRYVHVPLRRYSSDELKPVFLPPKTVVKTPSQTVLEVTAQEKVETSAQVSVDAPPEASAEAPAQANTEAPPKASAEEPPKAHTEAPPKVIMKVLSRAREEAPPEVSVDASPMVSVQTTPLLSMDVSPMVSGDTSAEVSVESSPEVSVETPPEASVEVSPEESGEAAPEASVEVPPKAAPENLVKDILASYPLAKKFPSSLPPCPRWSSSVLGYRLPFSQHAKQSHKTSPLSPSPFMSKQSAQSSLFYKMTPDQRALFSQSALGSFPKKRETASKTIRKCEAVSQRHMMSEESGIKSTPGTMSAEEATKILTERRRLAREQKLKDEERLQKDTEPSTVRKAKDITKKIVEDQAQEVSKTDDENLQQELEKKKASAHQKYQETLPQNGAIRIKAQEEDDSRKKEHERIMLQNLQERLERKKRIEEIMKRTRKTDASTSKAAEASGNDTYEEDEADDEDTTASESEKDSLDSLFPPGTSNKLRMAFRKPKKMPQQLVFLKDSPEPIYKETNISINGDIGSVIPKSKKDHLTQGKSYRPSKKRASTHRAKTGKAHETNTTSRSTPCLKPNQEPVCSTVVDLSHNTKSPVTNIPPKSHQQNAMGSTTPAQSHEAPSDEKKGSKPDSSGHSDV
ncbi:MAP7 domain-containing protein 3 isoform X1 [Lepus europaeus]|uniref:MAP7 domain-containing protein 3 isoform X1 n=1 Tax=Lepus europaeus TaxID=9983 RepID=UPI002B48E31F|nr:MAP7 domain-containing protein 3 isoform X1 [Lepus europaeus]